MPFKACSKEIMRDYTKNNPAEMERRQKIAAARTIHGHCVMPTGSPEFRTFTSWVMLRQRCTDVNSDDYKRYGARGITFCERWSDYNNFLSDVGLAPENRTIDRIDNDKNYEPGNVRWSTKKEQANNRRSNHLITINGETRTLSEWADISGITSSTIRARIKYNGGVVDEETILLRAKRTESIEDRRKRIDLAAAEMRAKNLKSQVAKEPKIA